MRRLGWLVVLAACGSSPRATGGGPDADVDAPSGDAPGDAALDATDATDAGDWPASACPGATDVADVPVLVGATYQVSPQIVRAGNRTAMIWIEHRQSAWETMFAWLDGAIHVAPGTTIVASPDDGHYSAVARIAWSGSEFGLVYEDDRIHGHGVYFARLDASGSLIAGSERKLGGATTGYQGMPALAWDPVHSQWGVAWNMTVSGPSHVRFARLDAHGELVASSELVLSSLDPAHSASLSDAGGSPLIWSGTRWDIAWREPDAIVVAHIPALGGAVTSQRIPAAAGQPPARPAIASDGTRDAIAWMQWGSHYQIEFALVDDQGVVAGTPAMLGDPDIYGGEPSIVWTGTHYAVGFGDESNAAPQTTPTGKMWVALFDAAGGLVAGSMRSVTCDGKLDFFGVIAWSGGELDLPYAVYDGTTDDADSRIIRFPSTVIP